MAPAVFWNAAAELATCSNVFAVSGSPADPTAVTLIITDPAGVATTYNWPTGANPLTRVSAGSFTHDVPCNSAVSGIWQGEWTGTGNVSDVQMFTWTTWPITLNQYYCSAEELKSRLRVTGDDFEIAIAVAGASRAVDGYCDRYFYRMTDTRTYVPRDLYETRLDDFVSITALATDPAGTTAQGGTFPISWPAGSFQPLPYNPVRLGELWPYTRIRAVGGLTFPWVVPHVLMRMDRVQVTGVFGWPAVPYAVRSATLITAAELYRMKGVPSAGEVLGEHPAAIIGANPMAGQLLAPYLRHAFLAA
jgi:hypothetical protein